MYRALYYGKIETQTYYIYILYIYILLALLSLSSVVKGFFVSRDSPQLSFVKCEMGNIFT